MKILTKKEVLKNIEFYVKETILGKTFIYPTDTLYGLGVNAEKDVFVEKINRIKNRSDKSYLIIVPSFSWIENFCQLNDKRLKFILEKVPGPFSFILNLNNNTNLIKQGKLSKFVVRENSIGVRIPNSWFYDLIISKSKVPLYLLRLISVERSLQFLLKLLIKKF